MRYKSTNFQHPKGLITFKETQRNMASRQQNGNSYFDGMMKQIMHFTNAIHCVSYVFEKDSRLMVRLFWLVVVLTAVINCIIMYQFLASRHDEQYIKTVVETSQMPVYKINFPAVALCPWSHVNWMRYKAAEEKFLPPYPDNKLRALFLDILLALEEMNLVKLETLITLKNHSIPQIIDKISVLELIKFMAFRCDELFVECMYDETPYDCCKIFVAERTEKGFCMVFNSLISLESEKKQVSS